MSESSAFTDKSGGIFRRGRPFIKMHGLSNDFVIVDGRDQPYRPSVEEIVRICDRHEGVGGDELLVLEPPRNGPETADAYAFVRIFNPDGREVEACGNATRCVGWLFLKESRHKEVVIDTLGGQLNSKTLKLSVWERPGVLTTACGTGACVAVGAAHRRGLTREKRMTVIMPAGSVELELRDDGSVAMTGAVEICYMGYFPVID